MRLRGVREKEVQDRLLSDSGEALGLESHQTGGDEEAVTVYVKTIDINTAVSM